MHLALVKILHQLSILFNGDHYFNFNNGKTSTNPLNNHCGLVHVALVVGAFSYALYGRVKFTYHFMTVPLLTFDFVTLCLLTILNLAIIATSRGIATNNLREVIKSFECTERNLKDQRDNNTGKASISVFFVMVLCIFLLVYDCFVWSYVLSLKFSHYHLFRDVQYFMVFVKLFFIEQLLGEISCKITELKEYLVVIMDDYRTEPEENKKENDNGEFTITGWTKSALEKAYKEEHSKLKAITKNLNDVVSAWKCFVGINSATFAMFHVLFVMEFLQMTCFIIAYYFSNLSGSLMENFLFVILRVAWSFCLLVI